MVDHLAARQESEGGEEAEDGVARLVDGEDDDPLLLRLTQPAQRGRGGGEGRGGGGGGGGG